MGSVLGWIGDLINYFALFIPRRIIVRRTDRLIKFKYDGSVEEKGPGLRWYLPFTTEVVEISTVRQPLDIRPTRLVTKDGIPCIVDCTVTYYIEDPITFVTCNYDSHLALSECVNSSLRSKLSEMTFQEIQKSQTLNDELREDVDEDVKSFGVEIEYVRIQDFSWVIPISLIGLESYKNVPPSIIA